jgi:cation diffusion facilitator family transporter
VVNLVAAVVALAALRWAAKPADEEHTYGHAKAEYFSAGIEGALICLAAVTIGVTAIDRLLHPQPLSDVGIGLAVSVVATAINLAVGLMLVRTGREHRSITLEADGRHLLTDVRTSVGVVVGVDLRMGSTRRDRRPRRRREHRVHGHHAAATLGRGADGPRAPRRSPA